MATKKFTGTSTYLVSRELERAVRSAMLLEKPLIIRGEPGTGKTMLAYAIAEALEMPIITWNIKSTTKAKDGLYVYDTVQRLNDSRFGTGDVADIKAYIHLGQIGQSFVAENQVVLLIDEIDKADLEFPNDLLNELDEMYFHIAETDEDVKTKHRPLVIITSNAEKELPDAFLRRCLFHYIEFPTPEFMAEIIKVHYPEIKPRLLEDCLKLFYELRKIDHLKKKPSTSELLDWLGVLIAEGFTKVKGDLVYPEALLKKEGDLELCLRQLARRY